MKIRNGFVSNSSSTSFIIRNTSDEAKTLVDFILENPGLIEDFRETYPWYKDTVCQATLLISAHKENLVFQPQTEQICIFGDEQGTLVGQVLDYMLRLGGSSKSFIWAYFDSMR